MAKEKLGKPTLFVCRNNIARSRWGAYEYETWYPGHGFSAGTDVETRGQLVEEWDDPELQKFIDLSSAIGLDIAKSERTPFDEISLRGIERVILLDKKAAEELESRRGGPLPLPIDIETWDLPDPHHLSEEESSDIYKIIKARVAALATKSMIQGGNGFNTEAHLPSAY